MIHCELCGQLYGIGDWYQCPHDRFAGATIGDDIPGGIVIENLGHDPVTFYSKKAIAAEADRRGLRLTDRWAGPHDQHLTNWSAGVTAKQLRDATALLSRGAPAVDPPATCETLTITERIITC